MSKRLDKDREERLEPLRMEIAISELVNLGYSVETDGNNKCLTFTHKGAKITYYPYSGWATGKTIKDGRGLKNLLKQLK